MKLQEIHIVWQCLDRTTELSISPSLDSITRPDQPHEVQLIRLMFEGFMYQQDEEFTVLQKDSFKVVYCTTASDYLVIHGDSKSPEPADYQGTIEELLHEFRAPISPRDLIEMKTAYMRTLLTISISK